LQILTETLSFDVPLVKVTESEYALELFHGPTLAFKDVGARFMSRCLGYFMKDENKKVTVLVATSGDTGGAVANGFYNVDGVEVIILYPSGKVSKVQEKQLTTLGGNIKAIEVNGTFDDCQALVKNAFNDVDVQAKLFLTSANSINVARWLPQQLYYAMAYVQWQNAEPPVISVPSGNFGNICAGLLLKKRGLPLGKFIAACNVNDVVPRFMQNSIYQPKPSTATISNAMDVGDPSNFVRILKLYDNDVQLLHQDFSAVTITDEVTKSQLLSTYQNYGYLCDTHGAVGLEALQQYHNKYNTKGIFLETAHPIKFYDVVQPIIGKEVSMPATIRAIIDKEKIALKMENNYTHFKDYLLTAK
jgi:threonine synthase